MGKIVNFIKEISIYILLIFVVVGLYFNKQELAIIGAVTFVLVSIVIENYKFKDVLNNPYKVKAKVIREKDNVLTLEYFVENKLYTTKIVETKFNGYFNEKENVVIRVGDEVDVYTSIKFPEFIVPYCERTIADKIVYTMIVSAGIVIDFTFIYLSFM